MLDHGNLWIVEDRIMIKNKKYQLSNVENQFLILAQIGDSWVVQYEYKNV